MINSLLFKIINDICSNDKNIAVFIYFIWLLQDLICVSPGCEENSQYVEQKQEGKICQILSLFS